MSKTNKERGRIQKGKMKKLLQHCMHDELINIIKIQHGIALHLVHLLLVHKQV